MKNGLLIWNVLLTAVAGYLLVSHFSSGKGTDSKVKDDPKDSVQHPAEFRMAYFEMDSLEANYEMVKQVMAELNAKELEITNEMERLGKDIQQKLAYYQNLAAGGNLSQAQSDEANRIVKGMDENMRARKAQLDQEYYTLNNRKQNEIKGKIETFLKEYNKTRGYSYIIAYEQGLFYYKDSAYNITADVVKGLNAEYKTSKGKSKE